MPRPPCDIEIKRCYSKYNGKASGFTHEFSLTDKRALGGYIISPMKEIEGPQSSAWPDIPETKFPILEKFFNQVDIKLLYHAHATPGPEWNFPALRRPFNMLFFILGGDAIVRHRKNVIPLRSGSAYLVPGELTCDYACKTRFELLSLHFRCELFQGFDVIVAGEQKVHSLKIEPSSATRSLLRALESSRLSAVAELKAILFKLLASVIDLDAKTLEKKLLIAQKYRLFFLFVDENLECGLSADQAAQTLGLSYSQFAASFKKDFGLSFKEFLTERLMAKSREALLLSPKRIREIAAEMKFEDECYFSRFFKKHAGMAPAEYRTVNALR